jgi:hypothetical protein
MNEWVAETERRHGWKGPRDSTRNVGVVKPVPEMIELALAYLAKVKYP